MQRRRDRSADLTRIKKADILFILGAAASILFAAYLLFFGEAAKQSSREGLSVCLDVILTTVFPFSVASQLLVSSGGCAAAGKTVGAPLKYIFGLSGPGAGVALLGLFGGYPAGAAAAAELYKSGQIGKKEAEKLISYTNNATPAFMINFAGPLFGPPGTGLLCCCVNIASSFVWALILRGRGERTAEPVKIRSEICIPAAISSCAVSAVSICASVIVFSVVSGMISVFAGPEVSGLISPLIEITTGLAGMSGVTAPGRFAASLSCAFTSFSGLCVASQVAAVSKSTGLDMKPYLAGKTVQAIISFFAVYLLYPCFLS